MRVYDAWVHLRPRLGPANNLSAARVRGRRAMAENRAVLPPDGGHAGRRPRMTRAHDRHITLPQRRRTLCMKIPGAWTSPAPPVHVQGLT